MSCPHRIPLGREHPRGPGRRRERYVARRLLTRGRVERREQSPVATHIGQDVAAQLPGRSGGPPVVHQSERFARVEYGQRCVAGGSRYAIIEFDRIPDPNVNVPVYRLFVLNLILVPT